MSKVGEMVRLHLGCSFPNFQAKASNLPEGIASFDLYQYMGRDSWCVLFSHPADFTPVCTTELARAVQLHSEFEKLNCKLVALSCNDVGSHEAWALDVMAHSQQQTKSNKTMPFPIIADESRGISNLLNIMDPDEVDDKTKMPLSCRSVFFINPNKQMRSMILYPATTGRSFDEILRVLKSLQLTEAKPVATPEGWKPGAKCMIIPTLPDEKAREVFPKGFQTVPLPSGKEYMRLADDPRGGS